MASIAVRVGEAPEVEAFLAQRIYEHNAAATGYADAESFTALKNDGGSVVAGVSGYTWGGCCYVSYLWVSASSRGKGCGSSLLDAVERHARSKRCRLVLVSTHSFQAPAFYAGRGYQLAARIADHPVGYSSSFYVKRLEGPVALAEYDFRMNTEQLKELQAPLKAKYREAPEAAVITLKADGTLGDGLTCSVQTGKALTAAGLHPATGGNGLSACSGDMLLEALVACAGVTLSAVATAIGVKVRKGSVHAEGELDFRGTLGVAKDAPVGFKAIRLRFDLDADATEDQIATLLKLTERYCVVGQSLRQPPTFSISRRA